MLMQMAVAVGIMFLQLLMLTAQKIRNFHTPVQVALR